MWVWITLVTAVVNQELSTTACSCDNKSESTVIAFDDSDCEPQLRKNTTAKFVRYGLYTNQPTSEQIPGILCSRWKVVKKVTTMFFIWQGIETFDHMALETTPEECMLMKARHSCGSQSMTLADGKWSYTESPASEWSWMRTIDNEKTHCLMEETTFTSYPTDGTITTPLGTANTSKGSLSHNHVTAIWDVFRNKENLASRTLLEKGNGEISEIADGLLRLIDHDKQTDYHMLINQTVSMNVSGALEYKVANSDHLTIQINGPVLDTPTNQTVSLNVSGGLEYRVANSDHLTIQINGPALNNPKGNIQATMEAQIQNLLDSTTDNENKLVNAIRSINCEIRKLRYAQVTSTAQYNGWLAAAQLKMPACTKLQAKGTTVTVIKCKPLNVTFETVTTKCGPQLRYGNYTLNTDGWELIPFIKCHNQNSFVNVNGIPYVHTNAAWVPMDIEIIKPREKITPTFKYQDVRFKTIEQQVNPARSGSSPNHVDIMADIIATMNDHATLDQTTQQRSFLSNHLISETFNLNHFSMLNKVWMYVTSLIFLVLITVAGRVLHGVGFHTLLYNQLCRPLKKKLTNSGTSSYPS